MDKLLFDKAAKELDKKRKKSWKQVTLFIKTLERNNSCLDIGCGNGRDCRTLVENGIKATGLDFSEEMIKTAKKNVDCNLVVSDIVKMPFKNESFDNFICIAMFHHIETEEKRLLALKEINRVIKSNGRGMITLWKKNNLADGFVDWLGKNAPLYYHFFKKEEITELLEKTGFKVLSFIEEDNNMFIEIKKEN